MLLTTGVYFPGNDHLSHPNRKARKSSTQKVPPVGLGSSVTISRKAKIHHRKFSHQPTGDSWTPQKITGGLCPKKKLLKIWLDLKYPPRKLASPLAFYIQGSFPLQVIRLAYILELHSLCPYAFMDPEWFGF